VFEAAELGQKVSKAEYKERALALRAALLKLQYRALEFGRFPVIIDFAGVDGAGKGTTVNTLSKWMDPRWLHVIAYLDPTAQEKARPRFWRYWRDLPPRGRTGLYRSGRYSRLLREHVYGHLDDRVFDDRLSENIRFENLLADDGALVLKFWMHLSESALKERLDTLADDPKLSYMVAEQDKQNLENYGAFVASAEKIVTRTNRPSAPWHIVEGTDERYRHLAVGETLQAALERHLDERESDAAIAPPPSQRKERQANGNGANGLTIFNGLDLSKGVARSKYRTQFKNLQARLGELGREANRQGLSVVLAFEGPDAAGKGGAIRRVVGCLDAHFYRVYQFAAPTDVERAYPYLWRFWPKLPRTGYVSVFDRSWYGRVLVERLEGYATEAEWRRAYNEINDFERQIVQRGILLIKYWLHISKDEQLRRFEARAASEHKRWKLTEEDWRNRERWDDYERAAHDMVQFTGTGEAPWVLVESNDKLYSRIKVLATLIEGLEKQLG
jgi:polyphosphate:AMP phosphotransferase